MSKADTLSNHYSEKFRKLDERRDVKEAHREGVDLLCSLLCELGYFNVVAEYKKIGTEDD